MGYTYRKLDPNSNEDIEAFLRFQDRLNDHLHSVAKPLNQEQIKWQRMRFANNDEATFFCECDGQIVGFINICNYHVVNNERPDDDIGLISDIMVDAAHANFGINAYNLLQLAIDELLSNNKNRAIMIVQEDNKTRFLHFALADKVVSSHECSRSDGTKTISYELLISNLNQTKKLTRNELAKRALEIRNRVENKNEEIGVLS